MIKQVMTIFVFFMLSSSIAVAEEHCEMDSSMVAGHYRLSTIVNNTKINDKKINDKKSTGGGAKSSEVDNGLVFWRRGSEVAYQYPNKHITEIWNQQINGRIRPIRYFDNYSRGIEYQASEVFGGQVSATSRLIDARNVWSEKFQIISDTFKNSMMLEKNIGEGCERLEYYIKKDESKTYRLVWSPSLGLPVEYKEMSVHRTFRMQLTEKITNIKLIDSFFDLRNLYQTTDYADIGDNESDPFLLGMINLGFIEGGASGFYNAGGGEMEAQTSHHSH